MATRDRRERGTGSVTELANGRWRAAVEMLPDPATGRRVRLTATGRTKAEALNKVRAKQRDYDKTGRLPGARGPKLSDWLDTWMTDIVRKRVSPKTWESYRNLIKTCIRPAIGAVRVNQLEPKHFRLMEDFITHGDPERGYEPRSSTTAALAYAVVRRALNDAVREGVANQNAALRVDPPRRDVPDIRILTPEQAALMIRMEPDPMWHVMWRIAFATGMRQGERLGITAGEIVERDGVTCILVEWQLKRWQSVPSRAELPAGVEARYLAPYTWLTRPKTKAGRRLVPLPADLARELIGYIAATGGRKPDELVFRQKRNGRPLRADVERIAWDKALERAGLPHVRVHSARHTAATAMVRMGIGDAVREAIIGHSNIDVTNQVYTHVDTAMALAAVQGIENQIAAASDGDLDRKEQDNE